MTHLPEWMHFAGCHVITSSPLEYSLEIELIRVWILNALYYQKMSHFPFFIPQKRKNLHRFIMQGLIEFYFLAGFLKTRKKQ